MSINIEKSRKLALVVDMYGCPNRCRHCWLGRLPNIPPENGADEMLVNSFRPYFEQIEYYSWLREPDFCGEYRARWERDKALIANRKGLSLQVFGGSSETGSMQSSSVKSA